MSVFSREYNRKARAAKQPKLVFTDIDGTGYYCDSRNDIVNKHGELVSLTAEQNVRAMLGCY